MNPPSTLFGVPLAIDDQLANALVRTLERAWQSTYGVRTGSLPKDLEAMGRFFDPSVRGERLRKAISELSDECPGAPLYADQLLVPLSDNRCMPTPEGRVVLEVLRRSESNEGPVIISPEEVAGAEHLLRKMYGDWSLAKVRKVVALQSGTASPLLPPAVGVALWLLVNRNVGPQRALRRPEDPLSRGFLDEAVATPVLHFAADLAPGNRRPEHFSLYGGYALTELRRRVSSGLSPTIDELYVREDHEARIVVFLGKDLARRPGISVGRLRGAFDHLVLSYREFVPRLAALGLSFERPAATSSLRDSLLRAFDAARINE